MSKLIKKGRAGFSLVELILIFVAITILVGIGWYVWSKQDTTEVDTQLTDTSQAAEEEPEITSVVWSFDGEVWSASGNVPDCPASPYLQTPVDLSKVTSILYPGQYRGGDYKSHGGFRFDGDTTQNVDVSIPMDGDLIAASRYYSSIVTGDPQYFLIFISPCGIMYRFDHITKFTDKFQEVMDTLPEAKIDDSRSTNFTPSIPVKAGELLGTEVGFPGNVFIDFGVNDLRAPNDQSKDPTYAAEHSDAIQYNYYGVCWFDLLPEADAATVKALPASGDEGNTSDYCT